MINYIFTVKLQGKFRESVGDTFYVNIKIVVFLILIIFGLGFENVVFRRIAGSNGELVMEEKL